VNFAKNRSIGGRLPGILRRSFHDEPYVPLTAKHKNFLKLVEGYGEGSVTVEIKEVEKVAVMTLSNPTKKGAISGVMMNQLAAEVDKLLDTPNPVRALVIRGVNGTFTSGADLGMVRERVNSPQHGVEMNLFMADTLNRIRNSSIISVALLSGFCVGGGAELCTTTDFRLMATYPGTKAHICFIHAKLGAFPAWGGARRLVSIVGRSNALRCLAMTEKISPERAQKLGLVDEVIDTSGVPDEKKDDFLFEKCCEFLKPFIDQPYPDSVRALKRAVAVDTDGGYGDPTEFEMEMLRTRWFSKDHRMGLKLPA
jgi:ethylmalonyl-CoA/methylmalonyl-CoA decarboxylase